VLRPRYGDALAQVWLLSMPEVSRIAVNVLVRLRKRCAHATCQSVTDVRLRRMKCDARQTFRCSCALCPIKIVPLPPCCATGWRTTAAEPCHTCEGQPPCANPPQKALFRCIGASCPIASGYGLTLKRLRSGGCPGVACALRPTEISQTKPTQRPVATITTHRAREKTAAIRAPNGGGPSSHEAMPRAVKR
jgi:hypothetical protein